MSDGSSGPYYPNGDSSWTPAPYYDPASEIPLPDPIPAPDTSTSVDYVEADRIELERRMDEFVENPIPAPDTSTSVDYVEADRIELERRMDEFVENPIERTIDSQSDSWTLPQDRAILDPASYDQFVSGVDDQLPSLDTGQTPPLACWPTSDTLQTPSDTSPMPSSDTWPMPPDLHELEERKNQQDWDRIAELARPPEDLPIGSLAPTDAWPEPPETYVASAETLFQKEILLQQEVEKAEAFLQSSEVRLAEAQEATRYAWEIYQERIKRAPKAVVVAEAFIGKGHEYELASKDENDAESDLAFAREELERAIETLRKARTVGK